MAKLPKWKDDAELIAWVGQQLPERHPEVLFPEMTTVQSGVPLQWWDDKAMEREVFEAALQGDFRMLGWMLDKRYSDDPDAVRPKQPVPLNRESMALIAKKLMGKIKRAPDLPKSGAAKQSPARRRADNPVHNAADEVAAIRAILKQHYPKQRGIRDRAIYIAAVRADIEPDRLLGHLSTNKHRIPN